MYLIHDVNGFTTSDTPILGDATGDILAYLCRQKWGLLDYNMYVSKGVIYYESTFFYNTHSMVFAFD